MVLYFVPTTTAALGGRYSISEANSGWHRVCRRSLREVACRPAFQFGVDIDIFTEKYYKLLLVPFVPLHLVKGDTMRPAEANVYQALLEGTAESDVTSALAGFWELAGFQIQSAKTYHAAFVATIEGGEDDNTAVTLRRIETFARKCGDFDVEELNFARDWAVRAAEIEHNFPKAEVEIQEVIRSRYRDEGQDPSQGLVDEVAFAKIMILGGNSSDAARYLRRLLDNPALQGQARLNAEWWYYVATLLRRHHGTARVLAGQSLVNKLDLKPKRSKAWRLTLIPFIGPRVARQIIRRKLGL